jgi:4'-phosphopantetheinyl transferase EntD
MEALVPAGVAVSWTVDDVPEWTLYPEELAHVRGACDRRRTEFASVRHCARAALTALGVAPAPIVPGRGGAPTWPTSVVGSMTHCRGYRAAAVARRSTAAAIGIDAEPHEALAEGARQIVARAEELSSLQALHEVDPTIHWDRLLFSAKESVFKVWYPLTGRRLGFAESSVSLTPDGRLEGTLLPAETPLRRLRGRWQVSDGLIATVITVLADDAAVRG